MSDDYLDEDKKSGRLILLLSACLAAFIAWAGYFEIDQTVHTTGQVILSARTQLVQTADGGVLKELTVQEGDTVTSGQLLAVLEKERVQANLEETRARTMSLKAALIRAKSNFKHPNLVLSSDAIPSLSLRNRVCTHSESVRWTRNFEPCKMV
jgi:multidrug efflux pump subunit AcrA (membrane-fusion protein)